MLLITVLFLLASKWYSTSTTLPQLYYRLSSRRSVGVREFRRLEKAGLRLSKVKLDITYFENCQELDLCPDMMKAKLPKLKAYRDKKSFYNKALQNQINILNDEMKVQLEVYTSRWRNISKKLSTLERLALTYNLNLFYRSESEKVLVTHKKKLLNL